MHQLVCDRAAPLVAEHVTVHHDNVTTDLAPHARGKMVDEPDRQVLTEAGVTPRMVNRHTGQRRAGV